MVMKQGLVLQSFTIRVKAINRVKLMTERGYVNVCVILETSLKNLQNQGGSLTCPLIFCPKGQT